MVVPQPRRSPSADLALERPGRRAENLARRCRATLFGTSDRRLGICFPRRADGGATRRADRAGLVRRQRPRTDARGRAGRRAACRLGLARRAAGSRLCLVGRHRRPLAACAFRRRHAAGLRRRRRHHRPDAGRRGRGAGRTRAAANRRRQSSLGRRRQHGPRPGPSRRRSVRRKRRAARSVAVCCPMAFLPHC